MKKIIKEQTMTSIDLLQARDFYKCPFVLGSSHVKTNYYTDGVMKKTANTDSKTPGNFTVGDILMIKKDFTYDVIRDGKIVKSNLPWNCSTLNKDVVLPQISADQMKSVDDLITFYKGLYQKEEPTADQISKKEFQKINLKDEPGFQDKIKFDYPIWKKTGKRQTQSPKQEEIIKTYTDKGWKDLGGKINPANKGLYIDPPLKLEEKYKDDFPEKYHLYFELSKVNTQPLVYELNNLIKLDLGSRQNCKKIISNYNILQQKKAPVNDATIENWKNSVKQCESNVKDYLDFNKTKNILEKLKTTSNNWSIGDNETSETTTDTQNENLNNLKSLVRESLIETKKTKEKNVLSEGKIVKARLSIISENVNFKTKKQKDKFFDELLSEMVYLNSQGFDKQVINEGFFDMLKSLLGHTPDGVMEYFKEYMGKWLVEHLTPMDSEGWFGSMIITGIGNLPIGDIPKLTDCNYLTKWISKTAAEGTVRKLTHEKGLDGPFYDILRNSIVDILDETSLGSKIEEALGSFICPLLGGVKNKMEATTDKLKQKALATS